MNLPRQQIHMPDGKRPEPKKKVKPHKPPVKKFDVEGMKAALAKLPPTFGKMLKN